MESVFESIPIETDVTSKEFQDYFPRVAVTNSINPIEFEISPSYNQLTDSEILLYVEGRVLNTDDTAVEPAGKVAPTNGFLNTLFKNVAVKVNNSIVSKSNDLYHYKSYIETLFTYSDAGKENFGDLEIFEKEPGGRLESFDEALNPSYKKRRKICVAPTATVAAVVGGNNPTPAIPAVPPTIKLAGRLHCDLFLQKRPIIPGVGISVILTQNLETIRLMSDETAKEQKFVIDSIFVRVFRINLTPSLLLNIERALLSKPATYYLSRVIIRTQQVGRLTTQISNFVLSNGQLPKHVLLTMIRSQNIDGNFKSNPYNFSLPGVDFCQINVNGTVFPSKPYNISRDGWIDPYINLLKIVKKFYSDTNIGVSLEDMKKDGYQILSFDLSGDLSGTTGSYHTPMRNGILSLDMHFKGDALPDPYTLLAYMAYDSTLQIDSRKNVIMNYIT